MLANGLNFLNGLDLAGFLSVFWFFFIFELPRYTLSSLAVGIRAAFDTPFSSPPLDHPVSVLLVGHNEGGVLRRAVTGLWEQTHSNLQVVVVDDGSSDDMADVGLSLQHKGLIDVFLSTGIRGGKAGALNLGLRHCYHEILVVMDIDTSLDRDAIARACAPLMNDTECGAVSGNIGVRNPSSGLLSSFQSIEYISNISLGRQFTAMFGILTIVSGGFGAFRKSAIETVGDWDVGPGDDSNLTTKLRRAGWKIRFAPDAWALTDVPATHTALFKQRLRWNRSLIRNRLRKFRSVFDPFQANFSVSDLVATANLLWFHLVLTAGFAIYIVNTVINYPDIAPILIVAIHVLAIIGDVLEFIVGLLFVRRPGMAQLLPYVVGYSFYIAYYQRLNRLIAYTSEIIFRRSYDDPFYPTKVRAAQEQF